MSEHLNLRVLVAVDNKGVGYVLDWKGDNGFHEAFSEEIHNCGRFAEDVLLDSPSEPGFWQFVGRLFYVGEGEDSEPDYDGKWFQLSVLPAFPAATSLDLPSVPADA